MHREDTIENGMLPHLSAETDEHSITPESGSTPSHNGEEGHAQEEELQFETKPPLLNGHGHSSTSKGDKTIQEEVKDLQRSFVVISHQMELIMKALQVNACPCAICMQQPSDAQRKDSKECLKEAPMSVFGRSGQQNCPNSNLSFSQQQQKLQQTMQSVSNAVGLGGLMGQNYSQSSAGGKLLPVIVDRKHVAEYAKVHGAIAAARKFGVPPPVASYYQKKDPVSTTTSSTSNLVNASSPGPSSEGESEAHGESTQPSTPSFNLSSVGMADLVRLNNPAHSTGSPGFLRGRGRGRPKLIGDELDADLVEYMVQVKQADPHGHLTASQALQIAKDYILEKAPGLLEEHGGHVKLKLTWAMKLVNRIAERQKEIELGLPPGTLQNMGKSINQIGSLSNNMMADMMAQGILNQHMFKEGNTSNSLGRSSGEGEGTEPTTPIVSATPEILNVRELQLRFDADGMLNLGCFAGQMADEDDENERDQSVASGVVDSTTGEIRMDTDMQ